MAKTHTMLGGQNALFVALDFAFFSQQGSGYKLLIVSPTSLQRQEQGVLA